MFSAAALLAVTGTAKLISAIYGPRIVYEHDPLTGITYKYLMLAIGAVEVCIALACVISRSYKHCIQAVAWLSTCFLLYRIGLLLLKWPHPCPCLGNLTDALHISPQLADNSMKGVLAYLLIGSYATLFWLWRQHGKVGGREQNDEVKAAGSGVGG